MDAVAGIDAPRVQRWFDAHVGGVDGELRFGPIAGGHSNLTFTVTDDSGRRWVLRRPPLGHVLATAHDMAREHRIISALADSGVPVPSIVGLCEDPEVNGAPFYVMDFVPGVVVRTREDAERFDPEVRATMGRSLIETLARLHTVDVDAVGLGDLGRRDGYLARQLKRWRTQFEKATTREVPRVLEVHESLAARMPDQQGVGIVHGDYRLDNCMMTPDGGVAAVLDWELCTLGDVLADLAGMIAYASERTPGAPTQPTSAEGYPSADEVRAIYAEHSQRDLEHLDYYVAFALWRVACIVEGVYTRYAAGAMGETDADTVEAFGNRVIVLSELAAETLASAR